MILTLSMPAAGRLLVPLLCAALWACAAPSVGPVAGAAAAPVADPADSPAASAGSANSLRRSEGRTSALQQREQAIAAWVRQAEQARAVGRLPEAHQALAQARALDPGHPRVATLADDLDRAERQQRRLAEAGRAEAAGRLTDARRELQAVLAEAPGHGAARRALLQLSDRLAAAELPPALSAALQKKVTLEFRDAPLRSVLEGISRSHALNFVFDREVRGDAKVTVFLRDVSIAQALQVILTTQQLDHKLLNDSTLLVYPATPAKQREHQELVTRSFYLVNAEAKQAQALVRTIAKSRDIHVDERLNLLIVRDTPEVIRLIERLLASIDLAEPEVVLEVEVLEVASNRLDEIGLQWPESLQYGIPGAIGQVDLGQRGNFRTSIVNPALVATLRGTVGRGNVLANPRLRARNHEKAKVVIGEKLPVFTTTSTANVGVSASVAYLDVGLKLEVEPTVQLDNDVVIKVNLDVSTLIGAVPGPQGSIAYRVGTRQATTSLRLRDGETQVLAGLIRDEDTKSVAGVPGLSGLPLVGRLFGKHTDERNKTEVVLLITPRVVRNLGLPEAQGSNTPAGVDANPGAAPMRLANSAALAMPVASGGAAFTAPRSVPRNDGPDTPEADRIAVLALATSGKIEAGGVAAVTLQNRSTVLIRGELEFDASLLALAQAGSAGAAPGRLPFDLSPGAEQVLLLRALPAAAGKAVTIGTANIIAALPSGEGVGVQVDGDGVLQVGKP